MKLQLLLALVAALLTACLSPLAQVETTPAPALPMAPFAQQPELPQIEQNFGNRSPYSLLTTVSGQNLGANSPLAAAMQALKQADSDEGKQEAQQKVKEALEKEYDAFLAQNEKQLEELEKRLEKLRDQLDRRRQAKNKMVELRLQMIVSEAEGLGWPEQMPQSNWRAFPPGMGVDMDLRLKEQLLDVPASPVPNSIPAGLAR
jgi:flagellar motor protein MotB